MRKMNTTLNLGNLNAGSINGAGKLKQGVRMLQQVNNARNENNNRNVELPRIDSSMIASIMAQVIAPQNVANTDRRFVPKYFPVFIDDNNMGNDIRRTLLLTQGEHSEKDILVSLQNLRTLCQINPY